MNIVIKTPESIEFGCIANSYKQKGKIVYDVVSERGSTFYGLTMQKKINAVFIDKPLTIKLGEHLKTLKINIENYEKLDS